MICGTAHAGVLDVAVELARLDGDRAARVRTEIDRLALRYRELAGETPASRADAFRKLLFEAEKFKAVPDLESARYLNIDSVLTGRKGYCLSLSVVALAVAEKVGAPLYGVAAPNHFFVRYDDGRFRRNLELTREGAAIEDADLRKRFGEHPLYLRNLKTDEVRAYLLHNRGYVALAARHYRPAHADFDAALRLVPGLPEAHRNLGVLLGQQKQWEAAKRSFARALAAYSQDVDALINLAICRHTLGDLDAAVQDLEMAVELDGDHARAATLLREWREEKRAGHTHGKADPPMPRPPADLQPGLRGVYYAGTRFERRVVERLDANIDFDWQNARPAPGVPQDGFSVRWDGYLKAPRTGTYTFFVAANDGVRVHVAGTDVLKNWRDMGYRNWYGSKDLHLAAGWHRIRIEHYDARGGARILLRVGVEGRRDPLALKEHLFSVKTERKRPG